MNTLRIAAFTGVFQHRSHDTITPLDEYVEIVFRDINPRLFGGVYSWRVKVVQSLMHSEENEEIVNFTTRCLHTACHIKDRIVVGQKTIIRLKRVDQGPYFWHEPVINGAAVR